MVYCASPSGQNQKSCHMVLKRTNLLLFAIYHIPAIHQERLHVEVLKTCAGGLSTKLLIQTQRPRVWTSNPSVIGQDDLQIFPTLFFSSQELEHQFSPQDPSKQRYSCKTSRNFKKKKNLLTSRVIEQIPNRRRSWTEGSVCILIVKQHIYH